MRSPGGPPYAAYLRVYEPLSAFEPDRREAWRQYAERISVPGGPAAAHRERLALGERDSGLRGPAALPPVASEPVDEEAYVLEAWRPVRGADRFRRSTGPYVCPADVALRAQQAWREFVGSAPQRLVDAVAPQAGRGVPAAVRGDGRGAPERSPHVLTARFSVPAAWFVLVDRRDSDPGVEGEEAPSRPAVFRTEMVQARRRIAGAIRVLLPGTGPDGPWRDEVARLGRWIEEFHPRAVVELDYGGLAALGDGRVGNDRSAELVTRLVEALARGRTAEAQRLRAQLDAFWAPVRALEQAN